MTCHGVWLPDSFGYTAAFPQLAKLAGMEWLLTQKLSWNQTNTLPHHTFWWEGIDGSRIFTHFPPVDTYTATLSGEELAHAVRNYAEKGRGTRSLVPFGHGDGGGGPTREMLERARRLRDLEGSPKVVISTPDEFFRAAREEYPDAPVWSGELYLELHRATYTTQSRTKAGNRRSEHLLREAELWAATATVHTGREYPYDELDRLWKTVLLNQFHDILPGSSIAWVHREAEATYARVRAELEQIIADAAAALAPATPRVANAGPFDRAPRWSCVPSELSGPAPRAPEARHRRGRGVRRGAGARHGVAGRQPRPTPSAVDRPHARQRPGPGRVGRRRAAGLGAATWRPGARCWPRGSGATCCSCTPTCRTSGTPGTSTRTTAAVTPT